MGVGMSRAWGATVAAVAVGLVWAAVPGAAQAAEQTIVPSRDFVASQSDTRATGKYEVVGSGLHIVTTGTTSTDKVAEYVAAGNVPLAGVGEPSLDYTNTAGGVPGFQLVVDFDADGAPDGILIGEPASYGNDWWVSNSAKQFVKDGAPSHDAGFGSANHGTLDGWRASFPNATVLLFGFSLGSGVKGDGVLNAINFNGDRYTFSAKVPDTTAPTLTCDVAAPGPQLDVRERGTGHGIGDRRRLRAEHADRLGGGRHHVGRVEDGRRSTASDVAGNTSTTTCPYTVVAGAPASVTLVSGGGPVRPGRHRLRPAGQGQGHRRRRQPGRGRDGHVLGADLRRDGHVRQQLGDHRQRRRRRRHRDRDRQHGRRGRVPPRSRASLRPRSP